MKYKMQVKIKTGKSPPKKIKPSIVVIMVKKEDFYLYKIKLLGKCLRMCATVQEQGTLVQLVVYP